MSINQRFITAVLETAKTDVPALPWARGARRQAFIAKRANLVPMRKTA